MADNFQAQSSAQGAEWEQTVANLVKNEGWTIIETNTRRHGIEIDLICHDSNGTEIWVEAKGSHRGKIPGMKRHDTVRKALFSGYHLKAVYESLDTQRPYYVIITSHVPETGNHAGWIDAALQFGAIDAIWTAKDIPAKVNQ